MSTSTRLRFRPVKYAASSLTPAAPADRRLRRCTGRPGRWRPPNRSRTPSGQVPGEVLVHLEHGHLVLVEDPLELVVGQDLTAVLGALQVVGLDVVPDSPRPCSPPRPGAAVLEPSSHALYQVPSVPAPEWSAYFVEHLYNNDSAYHR